MTEPQLPDGHLPARPPRFGERVAGQDFSGEATPVASQGSPPSSDDTVPRPPRHEAQPTGIEPTTVFPGQQTPPVVASPPPAPPASYGRPPVGPPPSYGVPPPVGPPSHPTPPVGPPLSYGVPPVGPPPLYGGPGGPLPAYGAANGPPPKKHSGLLVAGLVGLVVVVLGALAFVVTQITGGDEEVSEPSITDEDEPDETDPEVTELPIESTVAPADGSVDGLFVRVDARSSLVADADVQATLQEIGQRSGENPVSTIDDVLNLCAAIPIATSVNARVEWLRDNESVSAGVSRRMEVPADGNCINNNGAPIEPGAYEVSFTDDAGGETTIALFTIGAPTRSQSFVNDTGQPVCAVEVSPTTAGFFQPFEPTSGDPLADGEAIVIDVAEVEHEGRGVGCDDEPLGSFFFTPADGDIKLSDGSLVVVVPPTTEPPAEITDLELVNLDGQITSLDVPVISDDEEAAVIDVLLDAEGFLPVATTETSLALCAAWSTDGPLVADIVWEFNRVEVTRIPVQAIDGQVGTCVPPGSDRFQEGAYQAYLERGEVISSVQTFTVGREETQLAFVNDTGVEVCEVGFSPSLTNFYTFYDFGESADFDTSLAVGEGFTIVAPFIENDIKARDCAGNDVSEAFGIPPTDQTLNLSTGRP